MSNLLLFVTTILSCRLQWSLLWALLNTHRRDPGCESHLITVHTKGWTIPSKLQTLSWLNTFVFRTLFKLFVSVALLPSILICSIVNHKKSVDLLRGTQSSTEPWFTFGTHPTFLRVYFQPFIWESAKRTCWKDQASGDRINHRHSYLKSTNQLFHSNWCYIITGSD